MGLEKATLTLRNELMEHGDLYDGFVASIESAINDAPNYIKPNALAKMILKRVIGEEK